MFWCFIMFRTRKIYKQLVNWRLKIQSSSFKMFFFFYSAWWSFYSCPHWIAKAVKILKDRGKLLYIVMAVGKNILDRRLKCLPLWTERKFCLLLSFHFELRWWKSNKRYFDTKLHISLIRKKEIRTPFKKYFCYNNKSWNIHPHWFLTRDFVRIYSAHGRNKIKL